LSAFDVLKYIQQNYFQIS